MTITYYLTNFSTSELEKKLSAANVFCTFWLQKMLFATSAYNFSTSELQKCCEHLMFCAFSRPNVLFATAAYNFSTSELQKVLRNWCVLYIFTSKCAFHHIGVQFFDIWTSKSATNTSCFVHFHVQMCFSPQRRAIFNLSADHITPHPPL